jgi:hypothetical protein
VTVLVLVDRACAPGVLSDEVGSVPCGKHIGFSAVLRAAFEPNWIPGVAYVG